MGDQLVIVKDSVTATRTTVDSVPLQDEISQQLTSIMINDHFNLSSLTDDDFQKILFLLSPYLSAQDRIYVSIRDSISPKTKMQYLMSKVNESMKRNNKQANLDIHKFIHELLYLIKRYRLLKFQPGGKMCVHKIPEKYIVEDFWRKLFEICENLTDDETKFLRENYCNNDSTLQCAEHVIYSLWASKRISPSNLSILSSAFNALSRRDLKKIVEGMQTYSMDVKEPGQKRGLAVILNQRTFTKPTPQGLKEYKPYMEERKGTDADEEILKSLWESFGLDVSSHVDLTSQEISEVLSEIESKPFLYNVFVLCILSHGTEGHFMGSDRVAVELDFIYELFGGSTNFKGIPKVFFIQACQGNYEQQGIGGITHPVRNMRHDGPNFTDDANHPLFCDMLIGKSTIPGYVSYRSEEQGSLYIQHLAMALDELSETEHLTDIMTVVTRKIAEICIDKHYKQTATLVSQLRYKLYFKKLAS